MKSTWILTLASLSVTSLALAQEPPARTRAEATARMIDARVDQAIKQAGFEPAPAAEKEAIVRRLALDLNGCIPRSGTMVKFLKSRSKDKVEELVDAMLEAPEFDEHWANILAGAWVGRKLRPDSQYFRKFLQESLAKKMPFDAMVREILNASGPVDEKGASYFTLRWETSPTDVAAQSARVFMGLQIQCAQCHDHPFTEWKQEQFHHFAAYFSGMQRGNVMRGDQNVPEVKYSARPYNYKLKNATADQRFEPRFLFSFEASSKAKDPRAQVAELMTHPENPYFARMTVNRVWKALFGRALIEPVEDLDASPGYHPMLLSFLAQDFIASGYDLRHLVRSIVYSRTYQRGSLRPKGQKDPALEYEKVKDSKNTEKREAASLLAQQEVWLFARASARILTPEQIAASLVRATVLSEDEGAYVDPKVAERFENLRKNLVRQFDELFGEDEVANPDSFDGTIPQSLIMLNGNFLNEVIRPQMGTMLAQILKDTRAPADVVATIFFAALSRRPSKSEASAFTAYIQSQGATPQTYEDLLWALLNSSEFRMNH
jgi:hypothetical protein